MVLLLRHSGGLVALDLTQKLGTFGPTVVDEGLDIFPQTLHVFAHLLIESPRLGNARRETIKCFVHPFVSGHHGVPLPRNPFVFGLLRSHALVLKQVSVSLGQFLHQ